MTTGSISSHFASHSAAPASRIVKGTRFAPERTPSRQPITASRPSMNMPGSRPPMNKSSIAMPCATMPYSISGSESGKSRPSDPDAVSNPMENRSR